LVEPGNWSGCGPVMKSKKPESGIPASVHKTAGALHDAGLVDKATMREFDALRLTAVEPVTACGIRALREREQVSQPVFAQYLNVRKDAVSKGNRNAVRSGRTAVRSSCSIW